VGLCSLTLLFAHQKELQIINEIRSSKI